MAEIFLLWILRNSGKVWIVLMALAVVFGYNASKVRMDNSMEVWIPLKSPIKTQYERFLQEFGSEEYMLVAFQLPGGLSRDHLVMTGRLSRALKKESGIRSVWSLTEIFDRPSEYIDLFKIMILSSGFAKHLLIAPDGKAAGIIVLLSEGGLRDRGGVLKRIKETVAATLPHGPEAFIAGPSVINAELDHISQRNAMIYYPILFAACLFMLLMIFKSLTGVVVPALMAGFALMLTVGWMGILEAELNVITIAVLPLVMVTSLAYSIYFYNDYEGHGEHRPPAAVGSHESAVMKAYNNIHLPLFLSALTTVIGFLSLMASDIGPVSDLGLFVALGIGSTFLLAISFLPLLLMRFPRPHPKPRPSEPLHGPAGFFPRTGRFVLQSKRWVIAIFSLGMILAGIGMSNLSIETDALMFFPDDSPIVAAYHFIESRFTALAPVEVVITAQDAPWENHLPDYDTRMKIKSFQEDILQNPEIVTSKSIVDIWEDTISAELMETSAIPNQRLLQSLETASRYFINDRGTTTRISVRVKSLASNQFQTIVTYIEAKAREHFNGWRDVYITGIVPIIVDMQNQLLQSLMKSFLIAFGIIFGVFLLLLKSMKKAAICMFVNLLPIVVIFGFMGWMDIKLSVATVMIGSIAIGICVDDTVHFITRLKQESYGTADLHGPLLITLAATGKSIASTSLANLSGFIVLCFSGFVPMQQFGMLTGITIVIAMLADLLLLPALLAFFRIRL
ncbi:MAG: efflux RND transporter permease subunit [Thermodesulfobacteriota bacterium]